MMEKVWRRKLDYKPKHTTSSVKHGAGIDTACMAASGTKLIEFTNDLTDDRRSISTILQTQYLQSPQIVMTYKAENRKPSKQAALKVAAVKA